MRELVQLATAIALALNCGACTVEVAGTTSTGTSDVKSIKIDGSSTVAPISSAVAETFENANSDVRVRVNTSGTGGGFDRFSRGETDINDASRPIKSGERERCEAAGIEFVELKVAIDGLSVVIHRDNDWCTALTIDQLKAIWEKDSQVSRWSDLNPEWPDEPISLFAPDSKSGTYDYFVEAVLGEDGALRSDYQESVDDTVLATGVSGEPYAIGFFGFAYYVENRDKLKAVAIAPGDDIAAAVEPTEQAIEAGQYTPLSRPLFIYVNRESLRRPEVADFVTFYLSDEGQKLVAVKKYVRLNERQLAGSRDLLAQALGNPGKKLAQTTDLQ